MKRFFSLLGFLLFFISFVNGQNSTLSGKVTESGTGKQVPKTSVRISTLNISTLTDNEGFFEIKNVPYGKYTVTFTNDNFESAQTLIDVNVPALGLPAIELKKKAGETEGVSEISTIVLDQEDENKDQGQSY